LLLTSDIAELLFVLQTTPRINESQDILGVVQTYFSTHNFTWNSFISIYTFGASSIKGSLKWFVALDKQENRGIAFPHCFMPREVLIPKSAVRMVQWVLDEGIKKVNYIKSTALQSRLFSTLCSAMEDAHIKKFYWIRKRGGNLEGGSSEASVN
jgi:hypothetical protein